MFQDVRLPFTGAANAQHHAPALPLTRVTVPAGNITFGVTHSRPGDNYFQRFVTYRVQPRTGKML